MTVVLTWLLLDAPSLGITGIQAPTSERQGSMEHRCYKACSWPRCPPSRLSPSPPIPRLRNPSVWHFLWNLWPEKVLLVPRNTLSLSLWQLRIIHFTIYLASKQDYHQHNAPTGPDTVSLLICMFEHFFSRSSSIPVCLSCINLLDVLSVWGTWAVYLFLPHLSDCLLFVRCGAKDHTAILIFMSLPLKCLTEREGKPIQSDNCDAHRSSCDGEWYKRGGEGDRSVSRVSGKGWSKGWTKLEERVSPGETITKKDTSAENPRSKGNIVGSKWPTVEEKRL